MKTDFRHWYNIRIGPVAIKSNTWSHGLMFGFESDKASVSINADDEPYVERECWYIGLLLFKINVTFIWWGED